ncbi:hypothetical protein CB0940_02270 [Cercospora beticola]|uniref:Zn(2)-C6 fungal-type domain-containing protein n=2 Tax=Cercospora beticola TaxID=122368 RepID=A0A2G5I4E6_CERBT|nr:hypothetical protein CB0940_02270 [Cercospora beticola]PIA99372.1 hypothetical protein CB0940_02270 [Cercospora beticola]
MSQQPEKVRRSHRKSRNGCGPCKARRIKCDENHPDCLNCVRRHVVCHYNAKTGPSAPSPAVASTPRARRERTYPNSEPNQLRDHSTHSSVRTTVSSHTTPTQPVNTPSQSISTPPSDSGVALPRQNHDPFDATDMALLHHFFMAVAPTLADDSGSPIKWRAQLPKAVFASDCSLHALLAVSALHLARQRPMEREECLIKATEHHALTLAPLIKSLEHLDEHNAETTFLAAVFLCYHSLAKGPQPGQYLGFGDQADGEWIWVIKGVRTVLSMVRPFPQPQADPDHSPEAIAIHSPRESAPTPSSMPPVLDYEAPLAELSRIVALLEGEALAGTNYMRAVTTLRTAFEACYSSQQGTREARFGVNELQTRSVFRWLFCLEADFCQSLERQSPIALLIFAHFDVLVHQLRHIWYMEGWSLHIMQGILKHLPHHHHSWIRWPREQVMGSD